MFGSLYQSGYDPQKTKQIVHNFRHGFDLDYCGPLDVKKKVPNLKLRVGNKIQLWNKVMKEVGLGQYAGPFKEEEIPFDTFIQSPIGLVPKDNGTDTRLIFHLSYPRDGQSINSETPKDQCSVKYLDFDLAVLRCLEELSLASCPSNGLFAGKLDVRSTFRNLGMRVQDFKLLTMKAQSPLDVETYFFVDKCLPFGAAISCAHFQSVSNAIEHLVRFRTGRRAVNYLDDYLFISYLKELCNQQIRTFLEICKDINLPIAMEKTQWACKVIIFLGLLLNTIRQVICVPQEKINKAVQLIEEMKSSKKGKVMIHQVQRLCGILNFIGCSVVPGRAFTRWLYSLGATVRYRNDGRKIILKQHHHVKLTTEKRFDLDIWLYFLHHPAAFCRPFLDFARTWMAEELRFFTDSSRNAKLGCGGWCDQDWFSQMWNEQFIKKNQPSIAYLELYAVAVGVKLWLHRFKKRRIIIKCDNQSVVHMLNNSTSSCKNCMVLLRIIVLQCMIFNVKIYAKFVDTYSNEITDSLSRGQKTRFVRLTKDMHMKQFGEKIPESLWPMEKLWIN